MRQTLVVRKLINSSFVYIIASNLEVLRLPPLIFMNIRYTFWCKPLSQLYGALSTFFQRYGQPKWDTDWHTRSERTKLTEILVTSFARCYRTMSYRSRYRRSRLCCVSFWLNRREIRSGRTSKVNRGTIMTMASCATYSASYDRVRKCFAFGVRVAYFER